MLQIWILATNLLEIRALNLHDLLQPGPEPLAGEPDLVPGQLVEYNGDPVLKHSQCVTCRTIGVPFNCAAWVEVAEIAVRGS